MQTFGAPDNAESLVGRELLRGLRVGERLGATTEGPLYRGQYSATGPPVAITVLRLPSAAPDGSAPGSLPDGSAPSSLSERHWQQLRRACLIQHPNVAGLLDVGETPDGIAYAVAELLTGELVSDILAVSGGIPPTEAVDISLQVAEGLRAAHAAGVEHGSVSPQTVLVTGGGERLKVKLIGFDFTRQPEARADSPPRTAWADDRLDPTDDIAGLGVLLHWLLTGAPPDGERRTRAIPAALQRIIDRCLGARGRHYPTMAAVAEDLARQAALAQRPPRPVRYRPTLLGALVVGVVLLAAGIWFGWGRIRGESAEARSEVGTGTVDTAPDSPLLPAVRQAGRPVDSASRAGHPRPTAGAGRSDSNLATSRTVPPGNQTSSATLSPFRRSHPWAGEPQGQTYFSSSCPRALRAADLLYFRTEAEARATGRTRSRDPQCS
jgi:hypothetical protein